MKFNKKIVVASLSTVMGLSLVGAITGAVAWYQYSTRATASFVGMSVANSGVLQISKTGAANTWKRDLSGTTLTESTNDNKFMPVTFGKLGTNNTLGEKAYKQPESGKGPYTVTENQTVKDNWYVAEKKVEYVQFDMFLKSERLVGDAASNKTEGLLASKVYISDLTIQNATVDQNSDPVVKHAHEALRIHIASYEYENSAYANKKNVLISNTAITSTSPLNLYGKLDLDNDGQNDKNFGYVFEDGTDQDCMYGEENATQTTTGAVDIKATRDSSGNIADDASKLICTTSTDVDHPTKLTITIWLEGWHQINNSAIWSSADMANATFNVGLTFDVGRNAFN